MLYLDNAATTYPKPESVYEVIDSTQRNLAFNAGRGQYNVARKAEEIIEDTRKELCLLGNADNLVFTPSATHAINQIISGIKFGKGDIVYCSPYDHNAIARTLHEENKKNGAILKLFPLKNDFTIDLDELEYQFIMNKPKAVFCTHVSNVTGYILPVKEIGILAKKYSSMFIVDGAQAFGLVNVDIVDMHIDYYVFAGHKTTYGPFGIGGYLFNNNVTNIEPTIFGGTGTDSLNLDMPEEIPLKFEPSSKNVVAIAGLKEGLSYIKGINILEHEQKLLSYLIKKIKHIDGIHLYGILEIEKMTGILSFNLDGYKSEDLAKILNDEYDICVRGGYHCCPFIHKKLQTEIFSGTVRVSFSIFSTFDDINIFIDALDEISLS